MKIYNYFASEIEAFTFFRLVFIGKGIFCETLLKEPYLQEIPIKVQFGFSHDLQKLKIVCRALNTRKNQSINQVIILENAMIIWNEDIILYQNDSNRITIQAMNQREAFVVWEKFNKDKTIILFSNKVTKISTVQSKLQGLLPLFFKRL